LLEMLRFLLWPYLRIFFYGNKEIPISTQKKLSKLIGFDGKPIKF